MKALVYLGEQRMVVREEPARNRPLAGDYPDARRRHLWL